MIDAVFEDLLERRRRAIDAIVLALRQRYPIGSVVEVRHDAGRTVGRVRRYDEIRGELVLDHTTGPTHVLLPAGGDWSITTQENA